MSLPDITQAAWELGSAAFGLLNIRAIRKSKRLEGIHWAPTAFFFTWGVYNLWFYSALGLPVSWWAGCAITAVNLTWLAHVAYYGAGATMASFRFTAVMRRLSWWPLA